MNLFPQLISPAENFDIFYFLRNHTDLTTYYLQAKIYDIRTGAVLQTANLTQSPNNAHLYAKTIQAPADSSGYGRNIVAVATVYIDSGYTTKSTDYEEQEQYFLVKVMLPVVGSGGGVDYGTIRELLTEELDSRFKALPKPIPPAPAPEMPFDAVFGAIGAVQREINRIPKEIDLSAITAQIDRVESAIAALPAPERPDFSPVMQALSALSSSLSAADKRVMTMGASQGATFATAVRKALDGLKSTITEAIQSHEITVPLTGMAQPKQATPSPISIDHLM